MIELRERELLHAKALPAHGREPSIAQELDRHLAADVGALGQVDYAHTALAQQAQQSIRADLTLDQRRQRSEVEHCARCLIQAGIEQRIGLGVLGEHGQHFGREGFVSGAELCNSGALLFQRQVDGTGKKFLDLLPSALVHAGLLLASYARAVPKDCPLK